ncbi:MAG TPA: glycosyltransferase [Gemmatimonadales bacterium]|nr:glycosyltransferase [Gemmatimonadales bacterium]
MADPLPFVSVIVPCRNERQFIEHCLTSILATDYPPNSLEVLVVDGRSADGTREIVSEFARADSRVRLVDNPRRITAVALNLGIGLARGSLIAWMSAHNRYPSDYLRRCVEGLLAFGADNAGGGIVTVARGSGPWASAVVAALSHPFGVGNSKFRTAVGDGPPSWADTVFGGCYRRDVFQHVGGFNEHLVRGQDMEMNLRMRRAGCRTLFIPSLSSQYFARTDPGAFIKHSFANGAWAILPFAYSAGAPVGLRHLAPLGFVLSLALAAIIGLWNPIGWWLLGAAAALYLAVAVAVAVGAAVRARKALLVLLLPLSFALLHFSYGIGSLWGVVRLLALRLRRPAPASSPGPEAPRFEDLTETTGIPLSPEGAAMLYTRYAAAAEMARGRRVLELACGSGQGLGLVGAHAAWIIGGDYSAALLRGARRHYGSARPLVRLSADVLPFAAESADLVLLFEATYYVPDMHSCFREIARVLAPGGTALLVSANPERPDFISSPHSVHYHTADEFRSALRAAGLDVSVAGAFPVDPTEHGRRSGLLATLSRLLRRMLETLGLVPRTLRGRARLKRLVYGRLREVPPELPADFAALGPRTPVAPGPVPGYKVLYVTAHKPGSLSSLPGEHLACERERDGDYGADRKRQHST